MDNDIKIAIIGVFIMILAIAGVSYHEYTLTLNQYDTEGIVTEEIKKNGLFSYNRYCVVEFDKIKLPTKFESRPGCLFSIGDEVKITVYPDLDHVVISGLK